MATIKHNLSVEDPAGSIKQRTTEAKQLGVELDKVTSKAKKASAEYSAGSAAAKQNMEYGRGRGAMGATGASARDFANEAQGLGGLVRLYATYAANIFAVSAAFRSLSEAMNTTNMIRGLDQLGAATGVAMGGLAKRFAEASGGAVSLRESMEATTKAMSSGMTQQQFLQLGDVAKKASQALGIGMTDAVSRLTRGITKLEPELLDELGLFTKVGKATEDYARKIGKSVDSLTDFERRQAFANAVLKEGIDKFNEIDIPTNPYDKLLASLKNTTQGILEIINKGLIPLIDYLSKSPGALTAAIAGIAVLILRQALPIFTSYRAAMQKATEEVAKMAEAKAATARKSLEISRQARAKEMAEELKNINDTKVARIDAAEAQLKSLSKRGISKQVQGILDPLRPIGTITPQELAVLDRYGEKTTKVAGTYRALAAAIREAQQAEATFQTQASAAQAKINAPAKFGTAAYARQQDLEGARRQAASAALTSRVSETVSTAGTLAASKELLTGLKTEKLGAFRGGLTAVSGAASILAGTVGNLASIFSKFLGWLGLAVVAFELLDAVFSKNGKEVSKFNDAIALGEENAKAATLTYQKFNEKLVPQNIIASAQAVTNLRDSLKGIVDALEEADKKAGAWDRFIDGFKSLYGGDLKAKFGESLALQVEAGLLAITDPGLKASAEEKLMSLLDVTELSSESIAKAAKNIKGSEILGVGRDVVNVFTDISTQAQASADRLRSVEEGFKALDTSYLNLVNSLIQKDPLTDFAQNLIQQGFKLAETLKDPIAAAAQLRTILSDTSKLKLLAPDAQAALIQNKEQIASVIEEITLYESRVAEINKSIAEYKKTGNTGAQSIAQERLASNQEYLKEAGAKLVALTGTLGTAAIASVNKGFQLLESGFRRAIQEGILTQKKAVLDALPKTPGTISKGVELENKKIDLQIDQIQQTERLIKEMELSRLSSERIAIETKRDVDIRANVDNPNLQRQFAEDANKKLEPITKRETLLRSSNIARDITSGKIEKSEEARVALQMQLGTLQKIRELANQKELNQLNGKVEAVRADYEQQGQTIDRKLKLNAADRQAYETSESFRNLTLEQQQTGLTIYDREAESLQRNRELLESQKEIAVATVIQVMAQQKGWKDLYPEIESALQLGKQNLKNAEDVNASTTTAAKAERDRANNLAVITREYAKANVELERQNTLQGIQDQLSMDMLNIDKQVLEQRFAEYKVGEDSYNQQLRALELLQLAKERDNRLTALQGEYLLKINGLVEEYQRSDATGKALVQSKIVAASQAYEAQVGSINRVAEATIKLKTEQENLTVRQKGYDEIFKNSFNSMADAIANFALTGKLNFKDMVDSMVQDIIRLELRLQFQAAYMALRGSFLSMFAADGAAFDSGGVQKFARGGTFTNKIVDQPVLFKFAQGTGMMGEAGPEAIMPLTRDSSGNLGVRNPSGGGSGNVQVVVNNYTGQQVETKESINSRGQRKIELTVGDMGAGEMARTGSSTQRAVSSTFGLQPQLIRR
jgi:hypothetical protein